MPAKTVFVLVKTQDYFRVPYLTRESDVFTILGSLLIVYENANGIRALVCDIKTAGV